MECSRKCPICSSPHERLPAALGFALNALRVIGCRGSMQRPPSSFLNSKREALFGSLTSLPIAYVCCLLPFPC